jgi:uncharacterized membrane protein YphA (DoxX/SURF4 family)
MLKKFRLLFLFFITTSSLSVAAHEMYILESGEVEELLLYPAANPLDVMRAHIGEFSFWAIASFLFLLILLFVSNSKRLQEKVNPTLFKLKPYAFLVARVTVGLGLIFSGFQQALFGSEIRLADLFGGQRLIAQTVLIISGIAIMIGFCVRTTATIVLGIFVAAAVRYGPHLIMYLDYMAILITLALLGAGMPAFQNLAFPRKHQEAFSQKIHRKLYISFSRYRFLIIRVGFGASIMYAAFYGKFLHSAMALQVVLDYRLTDYFPFEASFVVLGAGILEMLFGLFFVLGIHLRFSAIFFTIFLFLSYLYFPEPAWPHLILAGGALAIFAHGYDDMTIFGRIFKRESREPIF